MRAQFYLITKVTQLYKYSWKVYYNENMIVNLSNNFSEIKKTLWKLVVGNRF